MSYKRSRSSWWSEGWHMDKICNNLVRKTEEASGICEQLSTHSEPVHTTYKYTKSGLKYKSTTWKGGGLPW